MGKEWQGRGVQCADLLLLPVVLLVVLSVGLWFYLLLFLLFYLFVYLFITYVINHITKQIFCQQEKIKFTATTPGASNKCPA